MTQSMEGLLILIGLVAFFTGSMWAIHQLDRRSEIYIPAPLPYLRAPVHSGSRKLRITSADTWAAVKLQKIAELWRESLPAEPSRRKPVLLPARAALREIERADVPAGLIWCVQTQGPELIRLAIWLLGRSGGTLGTTAVVGLYRHPDVRIRRDVARALKRMKAWNELRHMSAIDSDPQVRRLAMPPQRADFATRLAALTTGGMTPAEQSSSPGPTPLLWNVAPNAGRPPKTALWIRQILERIHRLLHGAARSQ